MEARFGLAGANKLNYGVELVDAKGVVFARGITEMGHAELKQQIGKRGADLAVHRDRLVLL